MKTLLICIFTISLAACGNSSTNSADDSSGGSSTSLTYQMSENGCDTGKHSFSSLSEYCAGLKNYALNNNGCAYSLRSDLYGTKCTAYGAFIETNIPPTASNTSFQSTSI